MSARHPDQEERLLKVIAPGAVGAASLIARAALQRAAELTPPTDGDFASDEAVLATFWAFARAIPMPPEAPPAEPDCVCGEPAVLHVWSEWAKSRPCNDAEEKCGCVNYTAKQPALMPPEDVEPDCECGMLAATHLLDGPSGKRPYIGDEDWWCLDYKPKETP